MIKNGSSTEKVTSFTFGALEAATDKNELEYKLFEIQELTGISTGRVDVSPKIIRAERDAEAKNNFKIDDIVRDLRGLSGQEKNDLESRIKIEVDKRLKETREQAYQEGLGKGRLEGSDAAMKEALEVHQTQIEQVAQMITDLQTQCQQQLVDNKHDIYEMCKRLVKWTVLKEVNDTDYLPKLLEKLILEMNQKQNLLIRVNPQDFASMDKVLEVIQSRLGTLTNVRVEPDTEIKGRGLVLETENGIVDGTPEAMFQTLDKLFETVVNHGGE